jgi:hypothetical protein
VDNDIDDSVLNELTNEDLQELGIKSLGHRKKLLAAFNEGAATASEKLQAEPEKSDERALETVAAPEVSLTAKLEKVLFERNITVWEAGFTGTYEAEVRITNRRVVLGSKTYALQNIDVVSVGNNEDAVNQHNAARASSVFWGWVFIVGGVAAFTLHWILAVICLLVGFAMIAGDDRVVAYSVQIGASASGDVFFTEN